MNKTEFYNCLLVFYSSGIEVINDKIILNSMEIEKPCKDFWTGWQRDLKQACFFNQSKKCAFCGEYLDNGELHHSLISRAEARGIFGALKPRVLHHSYNVLILHVDCHQRIVRAEAFRLLCQLYGEALIRGWYSGLPIKSKRADWMI